MGDILLCICDSKRYIQICFDVAESRVVWFIWIGCIFLFLQDMVAFSCCIFDGGEEEKQDMIAARERGWRGKFTKPGRIIRPGAIRINGKCPLTPLEV